MGCICFAIGEITIDHTRICFRWKQLRGQQRLDLRREQKCMPRAEVIEGFFAKSIPGAKELLAVSIPDGKGEHAVQVFDAVRSPPQVRGKENLGVTPGAEAVAGSKLFAKLEEIVDLTIENDG